MPGPTRSPDLPVLLLYDLDPTWPEADRQEVVADARTMERALAGQGWTVHHRPVTDGDLERLLATDDPRRCIVFNNCEGLPGVPRSDVQVASFLEERGYLFTGSPAETLARSWDKPRLKRLLDRAGVPTPRWRVQTRAVADGWGVFPAIVKACNEHCSVGIDTQSVVLDPGELQAGIARVLERLEQPALVEEFVGGRELHITVWGNDILEILPPAEMDFSAFDDVRDRLCTYDSKFVPGSTHYEGIVVRIPAPLSPGELEMVEKICLAAYRAMGCRDYARIDLRQGDDAFHVLDVNPNPDLSQESSTVYGAEAIGLSYGGLLSRLCELALRRRPGRRAAREAVAERTASTQLPV